jgi:hypothetical protein
MSQSDPNSSQSLCSGITATIATIATIGASSPEQILLVRQPKDFGLPIAAVRLSSRHERHTPITPGNYFPPTPDARRLRIEDEQRVNWRQVQSFEF